MAILKNNLWLFIILASTAAEACPVCAAAQGTSIEQRTLLIGIMWLLPVLVALGIGIKIYHSMKG